MNVESIMGNLLASLIWCSIPFFIGVVLVVRQHMNRKLAFKLLGKWVGYHLSRDRITFVPSSLDIKFSIYGLRAYFCENDYSFVGRIAERRNIIYIIFDKETKNGDHIMLFSLKMNRSGDKMIGVLAGATQHYEPAASKIIFTREAIPFEHVKDLFPEGATYICVANETSKPIE